MQTLGLGTITGIGIIVEISAEMGTITTMPLANVPNGNTMRMGEKDFIVHSFTSFTTFRGSPVEHQQIIYERSVFDEN